jgi:hypothetical protein
MSIEPETIREAALRLANECLCVCGHTMRQHYGQGGNLGCDECSDCLAFTDAAKAAIAPDKARKSGAIQSRSNR